MSQTLTIAPQSGGRVPSFDIGDRLRKARVTAGLEQSDLSELTGISVTSISAAEKGKTAPRRSTLILWAAATGVDIQWLREGRTSRYSVDA
ncbi:helix-turn-helix domain-containing protein [Agromyces archimandritae]|uniref:Helix-turn-helix transcriptional regulator n=1 Tax=Agromyces archimandritae TaxID=2781962 RepID=A0A975FLV9_9MICO|nr:helix-turn-helix transcriptional regulator [Agromyces archimandritae]QTX04127.1 helix-turn-helix transcriptional regulator [Agromyces archimandritae]